LLAILKGVIVYKYTPSPGLPDGRRHGHFPQMWQFKKMNGRGKFVAVSGRKVAVEGPNVAVENYF
jgi:hypothetical protein